MHQHRHAALHVATFLVTALGFPQQRANARAFELHLAKTGGRHPGLTGSPYLGTIWNGVPRFHLRCVLQCTREHRGDSGRQHLRVRRVDFSQRRTPRVVFR